MTRISRQALRARRYAFVNWLRDQLAMPYTDGRECDWPIVLGEIERVRGAWPSSLRNWEPPAAEKNGERMRRRHVIEMSEDLDFVLSCPTCGGDYLHHGKVEVFNRAQEDSSEGKHVIVDGMQVESGETISGSPSRSRDGLRIEFSCEDCPDSLALEIYQHKGNTLLCWSL